jgi:ribosomal-protein-alanine N-acetyltransferase
VIVDGGGAIVGRANLKSIDRTALTAEVGYRVAASHVGQGLATRALAHLLALARDEWRLRKLTAIVTEDNSASAAVLLKSGFSYVSRLPAVAVVQASAVDGLIYERAIAG